MIPISAWATPTRLCGIAAYSVAAISCIVAWRRTGTRRGSSRPGAVFTFLEVVLVLDMIFDIRWLIHNALESEALSLHFYDERRSPQAILLIILFAIFVTVVALVVRHFRGRPGVALAGCGATLSLACWMVEVISLHSIDRILYQPIGAMMTVAGIWWLSSLITSVGMLWDSFGSDAPTARR